MNSRTLESAASWGAASLLVSHVAFSTLAVVLFFLSRSDTRFGDSAIVQWFVFPYVIVAAYCLLGFGWLGLILLPGAVGLVSAVYAVPLSLAAGLIRAAWLFPLRRLPTLTRTFFPPTNPA